MDIFWGLVLIIFTLLMSPIIGAAFIVGLVYRTLKFGFRKGYKFVDFITERC